MRKSLFLSTDMVEPAKRNEFWREVGRPMFEISPGASDDTPLEGMIQTHALGSLMIGSSSFNWQIYRRDRKTIMKSGFDQYLLQCLTEGGMKGNFDGVDVVANPGDICVFDLNCPFMTDAAAGRRLSVMIPRAPIESAAGGRSLHGVVFRAGAPVTNFLGGFITNLWQTIEALEPADALAIEASIIDFIAVTLSRGDMVAMPQSPATTAMLRHRALQLIDAGLSNPALGPDMLIDQLKISRAHLYRIFSGDGGVSAFIRDRRLDAAFRHLTTARNDRQSIAEIARQFGFSSNGQFARAFRARFAIAPREARRELDQVSDRMIPQFGMNGHFSVISHSHSD